MPATRNALVRAFLPESPFARHLGLEIEHLDADGAELRLPFAAEHATFADTVHGGAIATLIDTAGMVAAWGDANVLPLAIHGFPPYRALPFARGQIG